MRLVQGSLGAVVNNGLMPNPMRIAEPDWLCDANPRHGLASVRLTPRKAVCSGCARSVQELIFDGRYAEAMARLGVQPNKDGWR